MRAKIFSVIDWLIENEAIAKIANGEDFGFVVGIDIPADKIDEVVEKIIEIMKEELDKDKEEK